MASVPHSVGLPHTDEDTLRALLDEHGAALLRHLLPLTEGDRGRAEDLVQETLLRAWRHPEALNPDRGPVRPWLFAVARNLAIDARRSRRSRPREVSDEALAVVPDPDDELERAVESWTVAEGLLALRPEHRQVLLEVYFRARPVKEAAHVLGIPPGTVKSRTYYALRALRLALEERGIVS